MIDNQTLRVLKQRRSVRSYREDQVNPEELQAVLEAGLYAPNAGDQAWHFTVVQNKGILEKLNRLAKENARQMDLEHFQRLGSDAQFNCLYDAPSLIIVSGDTRIPIPLEADCAAALENMLLAAESLGIGSCWIFFVMLAFQSPQGAGLLTELKIPTGYKPYYAAVLGYPSAPPTKAPDRKANLITIIQ